MIHSRSLVLKQNFAKIIALQNNIIKVVEKRSVALIQFVNLGNNAKY